MTLGELQSARALVRDELAENERHVLADLRKPAPEIAQMPIGDLLCWCDGLEEATVSRILAASEIPWGRPTRRLSTRDQAMICFQIKVRHPETWERWKAGLQGRRAT